MRMHMTGARSRRGTQEWPGLGVRTWGDFRGRGPSLTTPPPV